MVTAVSKKARLSGVRHSPLRAVIARYRISGLELFHATLNSGETALPVFSSLEAARESLPAFTSGLGWYTRECSAGELISILAGPCAEVRWILLDSSPLFAAAPDSLTGLLYKKDFIASLA